MYSILLALKVLKSYFGSKNQQHIYESVYNSLEKINFEDERTISEAILNITKNLENNQKLKKAFLCLIKSSIDFQRGQFEEDTSIKIPNACSKQNPKILVNNEIKNNNKKITLKNCKIIKNHEDTNPQTSIILDKNLEKKEKNEITNKDSEVMKVKLKSDENSTAKKNTENSPAVQAIDVKPIPTYGMAKCDSNEEIIDIITTTSNTAELPSCKNIEELKKGNVINLKICKNKFLECSVGNSLVRGLSRSHSMPTTSHDVTSSMTKNENLTNVTNSTDKNKINKKVIKYIKNVNQDKGNTKLLNNIDENKLIKLNKNLFNNRLIDLPQSKNSIMKTNPVSTKPLFQTKLSLSTSSPQQKHVLLFSKDIEKNNNFLSKYNSNLKINWTSKRQISPDKKTEKTEKLKRKKGTTKDPDGSEDDLIIVDDENY